MPTTTTPTSDGGSLVTFTDDSGVVEGIAKFDSLGHKVFANTYGSNGAILFEDGYNSAGTVVIQISFGENGSYEVTNYDNSGNILNIYNYGPGGILTNVNTYDTNGKIIEEDNYTLSGKISFIETISQDSLNALKITTDTSINSAGIVYQQSEIARLSNGQTIYSEYFNQFDPVSGEIQFHGDVVIGVGGTNVYYNDDGSHANISFSVQGNQNVDTFEAFYNAQGVEVWANALDSHHRVVNQYGFASNGVIIAEIDNIYTSPLSPAGSVDATLTTHWTSAGVLVDQTARYGDGALNYVKHYDANGVLFEEDLYTSGSPHTLQTVETFNTAGVLTFLAGYNGSQQTYLNAFDPISGALQYQLGYSVTGVLIAEIDHAADGSYDIKTFNGSAQLLTTTGYSASGQETYLNTYDPSSRLLLSQVGYANGVRAVEIDHASDGSYTNSQFSSVGLTGETFYNSAGSVLATLTNDPSSEVYTLTGAVAGVTLTAITGSGTLTAGGAATTFAVAQGFGSAVVSNFVAAGAGHDIVQVDTHLAADYGHLLADAQNSGSDVLLTFNSHDHLTLHGLQLSQLSSSDFVFV